MSRYDGGGRSAPGGRVAFGGFHKAAADRQYLLPVLHSVQDAVGWVSHGAINYIAERLSLGPAEAFGVATFYDLIATEPAPARVAHVCDDIACKARGVDAMLEQLEAMAGPAGVESDGGMWKRSPCLGQCDKGSAAFLQAAGEPNRIVAPASAEQIIEILSAASPADDVADAPTAHVGDTDQARLLARVESSTPTLEAYMATGGYEALKRAYAVGHKAVIQHVVDSGIRGRGGAAFPAGVKWQAVAEHDGDKYVVCNADESEPGTFKDRVLLERDPFAIIEAMTIAGYAVGATKGFVYLRGEYPIAERILVGALDAARGAGLLGDGIMGTDHGFDLELRLGAGAYICGEETALFNSIEGFRGEPRQKPPFPTDAGLFARPTVVNNVETLANIPWIVRDGGEAFAARGTVESTGTKLFCVSGNVNQPGLYEVDFGATVRDLVGLAGGPTSDVGAVLVGGAAGSFITEDDFDMPLTFEDTRARGVGLGSGVIIVFDTTIDMGAIVTRIAEFFGDESCGLCIPCRAGTVRQEESLVRLRAPGADRSHELEILDQLDIALRDGSVCGLGQAASVAVQSAIRLGLIGAAP